MSRSANLAGTGLALLVLFTPATALANSLDYGPMLVWFPVGICVAATMLGGSVHVLVRLVGPKKKADRNLGLTLGTMAAAVALLWPFWVNVWLRSLQVAENLMPVEILAAICLAASVTLVIRSRQRFTAVEEIDPTPEDDHSQWNPAHEAPPDEGDGQ